MVVKHIPCVRIVGGVCFLGLVKRPFPVACGGLAFFHESVGIGFDEAGEAKRGYIFAFPAVIVDGAREKGELDDASEGAMVVSPELHGVGVDANAGLDDCWIFQYLYESPWKFSH